MTVMIVNATLLYTYEHFESVESRRLRELHSFFTLGSRYKGMVIYLLPTRIYLTEYITYRQCNSIMDHISLFLKSYTFAHLNLHTKVKSEDSKLLFIMNPLDHLQKPKNKTRV